MAINKVEFISSTEFVFKFLLAVILTAYITVTMIMYLQMAIYLFSPEFGMVS